MVKYKFKLLFSLLDISLGYYFSTPEPVRYANDEKDHYLSRTE